MKAIRIQQAGGPEVMALVDVPTPVPGPGEVLVRNHAVGVNFIDTYNRTGLYPLPLPSGLGLEGAGVVEAVGEGVTRFAPGDRIAYASGPAGAYAEAHVVKAVQAVRLPEGVPFKPAAATLLRGMTAEYLVQRCAPPKPGSTVLIHAAAGGLGLILVQWCKSLGVRTIGTVGSEAKAEVARAHGCDLVILSTASDLVEQIRADTGGTGVAIVYDGVGADTFETSLNSLQRRGLLVCIGNASGPVPPFPPLRLANGSLFVTRPRLGDYTATVEELDQSAADWFAMIENGKIKVDIGAEWPLAEAAEAHRALEGRRTTGGIVLVP